MSISNFISNCVMTATIFLSSSDVVFSFRVVLILCAAPLIDGSLISTISFLLRCTHSNLEMQINRFPMKWSLTRIHIIIQLYG